VAKLTAGTSGKQQYILFAVRDDSRPSDLIMAETVDTDQAYNVWGGKSLYGTIASRSDTANKALKVSFNRPYYGDETNGVGNFFFWELPMIQWLEAQGYDISYATNVDVDRDPNLLLTHKAFLSIGHDEYWSWAMRDHVEYARDHGVSLGFFSGNVSYWQVRFEPSAVSGEAERTMVGYKEFWAQDPITPSYLKTNEFRYQPVNRSEDAMVGVRYVTQARPIMIVEDASHWIFSGTGLHNGDRLANPDGTSFLGYEVDNMGPFSPADTQRLAHSPSTANAAYFSDMTVYRAPSGATVFASGSIGWSQTVPAIQQMTRNVLARFISNAFDDTTPVRASPPAPFTAQDIGDTGRPGFVSLPGAQQFTLNGAGQDTYRGNDALYFASQTLSGDGQIVARLTSLQNYWDNRAGIMIRDSLSPDAKFISLQGRPSGSSGALNEGVEFMTRGQAGAIPVMQSRQDISLPTWLRLSRTGNTFTASVSPDGQSWSAVGTITQPMSSAVYVGADVLSAQRGVWVSASFDNVSVAANQAAPPPPPGGACPSVVLSKTFLYSGAPESDWFIGVTTPTSACSWAPSVDVPWIVISSLSPSPAAGPGSFWIQVVKNSGAARTGHLTIAGTTYSVTQEGAASPPPSDGVCPSVSVNFNRPLLYSGAPEDDWFVTVTTPTSTCSWTPTVDSSWLVVSAIKPVPTVGSGSFMLQIQKNTTGAFRFGNVTIGGVAYRITQEN
jgi:hypothetical protein